MPPHSGGVPGQTAGNIDPEILRGSRPAMYRPKLFAVVSLKLKYASAAFVAVLLAMAAVTALLVWQHDMDTRRLGAMAEDTARQRVDVELRARASSTAAHAADAI